MGSYQNTSLDNINQGFEAREALSRATSLDLKFIDLIRFPINPDTLQIIPAPRAEALQAVCFEKKGLSLKIATTDPTNPAFKKLAEGFEDQKFEVEVFVATLSGIKSALKLYHQELLNKKEVQLTYDFDEQSGQTLESEFMRFAQLEELIHEKTPAEALNQIEILALQLKASDIHLQPYPEKVELRFRLDGLLHDICEINPEVGAKIVNHIKYEAGMRSNLTQVPQDGHLSFEANGRSVDLRVSTLPTESVESVVMRVLDTNKGIKSFEDLGFAAPVREDIDRLLRRKNGMVLVTGPTGSGKTTTLYSMLADINKPETKIVTLEDPIEYHLDGITQSQINEKADYNFSTGLKSLLRHDPNVVLIGEIRNLETAKLASEASLTGHIVFSSLHTNSSFGAITRLRNLGLESYNLASSLNGILAQRLLRKACSHCQEKTEIKTGAFLKFEEAVQRIANSHYEVPSHFIAETQTLQTITTKGCEKCAHTGYLGQTIICEYLNLDPEVKALISDGIPELELATLYRDKNPNHLSLFEDGIRKVLMGQTTLEEVYRVAG